MPGFALNGDGYNFTQSKTGTAAFTAAAVTPATTRAGDMYGMSDKSLATVNSFVGI